MNRQLIFISTVFCTAAFSACLFAGETAFVHFEDQSRGTIVEGPGTLHPYLEIAPVNGADSLVVIETGFGLHGSCHDETSSACTPFAYRAPNGTGAPNNCLEDASGNQVELLAYPPAPGVETAKGFTDIDSTRDKTPQNIKFTFQGYKVTRFEVLITDFGDLNISPDYPGDPVPSPKPFHSFGLWAYGSPAADPQDTNWVASDVITYETEEVINPTTSWNPDFGNLFVTGDGCSESDSNGDYPGNHVLRVQNDDGIGVVYLLAPIGADPRVGFDSIRFELIGEEGCTPGNWKSPQNQREWLETGYHQDDLYADVFGVTPSPNFHADTLLAALRQGGGKERALGRHAVAALLNSAHPDVVYPYSETEIIDIVQAAYASGDFNLAKDMLESGNLEGDPGFCD